MKIYQVDAFCRELFSGNPAAVCPLQHWPEDALMQQIAAENNLAETAFYGPLTSVLPDEPPWAAQGDANHYRLRWFTPTIEVDLCGHATLATAHVLFNHEGHTSNEITFLSRSGELKVTKKDDRLELDFPTDTLQPVEITNEMKTWFQTEPLLEAYKGRSDYLLVFPDEAAIAYIQPNLEAIGRADCRGVIVTAKGDNVDFVSRFFAPQTGVVEDPATGSAHTSLTPYWSKKLKKTTLSAIQLSARKGYLTCHDRGARIGISGRAKTYMIGELQSPAD